MGRNLRSFAVLLSILALLFGSYETADAKKKKRRRGKKSSKKALKVKPSKKDAGKPSKKSSSKTSSKKKKSSKKKRVKFQPSKKRTSKPRGTAIEQALSLYKQGQYTKAAIAFHRIASKKTRASEETRQRATFSLGKTLYQMGYYAGSLHYFDEIVERGPRHRFYKPTLKWLVALARVLPESSGILDKVGQYGVSVVDDPAAQEVRNQLLYLMGRYFFRRNKLDTAIGLLSRVEETHPFFLQAKMLEGATYVRKYEPKPAVVAFKEILRIAADRPKQFSSSEIDRFEELAQLQMARVFYSTRQYDTSIKYFEKLTPRSPDWAESLFEASWAYFMKTNFSKALGNIHTVNSPYFETEFYPEAPLLSAVIFYKYCLYDRALEMVAGYNAKYKPLRANLKQVVAKHEDDAEFYKYIQTIVDGKAGLDDDTRRLVTGVLRDKTLKKSFNWVKELAKELSMLDKSGAVWKSSQIADAVLETLTLQQSLATEEAGKLARERITRQIRELQEHTRNGLKIKLQVLEEKAGHFTKKARGEKISGNHKVDPIIVDDEHFMWKFDGEYWKDELGFYRFRIRSQCADQKTN